jgi:hypothetical protein
MVIMLVLASSSMNKGATRGMGAETVFVLLEAAAFFFGTSAADPVCGDGVCAKRTGTIAAEIQQAQRNLRNAGR